MIDTDRLGDLEDQYIDLDFANMQWFRASVQIEKQSSKFGIQWEHELAFVYKTILENG